MSRQLVRRNYLRQTGGVALILSYAPIPVGAAAMPMEDVQQDNDMLGFKRHATNSEWKNTLEALGPPVDDAELSEMHGKFIGPESVSFFGITMLTSWQDQSGVTTMARLEFNVDFLNSSGGGEPTPQVLIDWVRDGDANLDVTSTSEGYVAMPVGPDQVIPVGALDTLAGAGQANIIAGADNIAGNGIQIVVMPRNLVPEMNNGELTPLTSTADMSFDDGDKLQFRVANNEIGIVMTGNNGLDSTMQSVGGDMGQILQQTILNSNNNNVLNSATLVFGISDSLQNTGRINADGALLAMKGFGY